MKINYKNTALGLLEKMDHTQFRIIDDGGVTTHEQKMRLAKSVIDIWPNFLPFFLKKVRYISEPFYEAYDKAAHKLGGVIDNEDLDESGVFVYKASQSETNTVFYRLQTWGKDKDFEMDATVIIFNSKTDRDKPSLGIVSQRRPGMPVGGARYYGAKAAEKAGITPISVIADILTIVLFLKYCDLETKEIKAGKKDHHAGIKYVNETKNNIEVLDSTWFTTIVRSEGFSVGKDTGGFFKLQPHGPNNSLRRLTWIWPYEKQGYTRTAKILNQQ